MENTTPQTSEGVDSSEEKKYFQDSIPQITLSKGGGAIQGIGENSPQTPLQALAPLPSQSPPVQTVQDLVQNSHSLMILAQATALSVSAGH